MTEFQALLTQNTWQNLIFIPTAILLGFLHGLEPGHSKTMMAAFIIAIKGTVKQAMLLGLVMTISHTLIVWLVAFIGLYLGQHFSYSAVESLFSYISSSIIIALGIWLFWQTRKELQHIKQHSQQHCHIDEEQLQTQHELEHAKEIKNYLANKKITNWQIILLGFSGGMIPCPAALTVFLLCLKVKTYFLGIVLVLCFGIGLALTLISVAVVVAYSINKMPSGKFKQLNKYIKRLPYISAVVIILSGVYMLYAAI